MYNVILCIYQVLSVRYCMQTHIQMTTNCCISPRFMSPHISTGYKYIRECQKIDILQLVSIVSKQYIYLHGHCLIFFFFFLLLSSFFFFFYCHIRVLYIVQILCRMKFSFGAIYTRIIICEGQMS